MDLAARAPHVLAAVLALAAPAFAEDPPPAPAAPEERGTPLAGEAYRGELFGEPFDLPARDRADVKAVLLGGALHSPRVAAHRSDLFAALYWRRFGEASFLRATLSGIQNDVELARRLDGQDGFELVARANTYTPIGERTEAIDDDEVKVDRVKFGRILGELGAGYRVKLGAAVDNELRIDAFYDAAWVYTRRGQDTGDFIQLPPDTLEHGGHLRVRFDLMKRNLIEHPHSGVSAGADLELLRRDRWGDAAFTSYLYREKQTRDYFRAQAYAVAATGLPFLPERHRFVLSLHGGWSPARDLDRFSAFRLGSGPVNIESYDMARRPISGLLFDQLRVRDYLVSCIEYRVEVLFFLFLHLRYTQTLANHLGRHADGGTEFTRQLGHTLATAATCGFFGQSSIYLEYAFSTAQHRGRDGHSGLLVIAKAF